MKIKVTKGGIYGKDGEIKVGAIIEVSEEPKFWAGRYEVVEGQMVVNPKNLQPVDGDKPDELTKLRAEYLELTGKKPDGRWSADKIRQKVEEAK